MTADRSWHVGGIEYPTREAALDVIGLGSAILTEVTGASAVTMTVRTERCPTCDRPYQVVGAAGLIRLMSEGPPCGCAHAEIAAAEQERQDELELSDERGAEWYQAPLEAPERVVSAPLPRVAVRIERDPLSPSGWGRVRITQAELDAERAEIAEAKRLRRTCRTVELRSWDQFDAKTDLYDVVVMADPVTS